MTIDFNSVRDCVCRRNNKYEVDKRYYFPFQKRKRWAFWTSLISVLVPAAFISMPVWGDWELFVRYSFIFVIQVFWEIVWSATQALWELARDVSKRVCSERLGGARSGWRRSFIQCSVRLLETSFSALCACLRRHSVLWELVWDAIQCSESLFGGAIQCSESLLEAPFSAVRARSDVFRVLLHNVMQNYVLLHNIFWFFCLHMQ